MVVAAVVRLLEAVVPAMVMEEEAKATVEAATAAEVVTVLEPVVMEREEMGKPMAEATLAVVGVEARVGVEVAAREEPVGSQDPGQASPSRSRSSAPRQLRPTGRPQAC